eukprot:snap_masked-scaffold_2-processed-gene-11.8-mRNA-1 protein AED:0.07 eAED:0.07 QI:33/1/1/1/1/1/3/107/165
MQEHKSSSVQLTSFHVFKEFAQRDIYTGKCKILSSECFQMWLNSRKRTPKEPERSFKKALVAHLRNRDGRSPFTEEEEKAILEELRKPEPWPSFLNRSKRRRRVKSRLTGQPAFHEGKNIELILRNRGENIEKDQRGRVKSIEKSKEEFSNSELLFLKEMIELLR